MTRSVEIESRDRPNWHRLAASHNALADLEISMERYPEARAHLETAVAAWRQYDAHTDVAVGLSNLANVANREGLFAEALAYAVEAFEADRLVLGDGHAELAFSLTCIGEAQIGLGNYLEAIDVLTQAFELRAVNEVPAGNRAWTSWLLGRCLVESAQDIQRGMALVVEAQEVFSGMSGAAESELGEVTAWLAGRA